ncbi:hypothetical protein [Endozoicomonas lisbonensis]|uniref:Molecular chaperone GrpE (Heat shock protein) n=1 Tax=Endozoicomonas lisbonensis TaxID=3120522 RepID=A0ABV2SB07_9GAMM
MKKNIRTTGRFLFLMALFLHSISSNGDTGEGTYVITDADRIINSQALIFRCDKERLYYDEYAPRVPMDEYNIQHPVKTILSPAGEVMTGFDLRNGNVFSHTPPFRLNSEAGTDNDSSEPVWSEKQQLIIKRMGEVIENSFRHNLEGILATSYLKNKCYEAYMIYMYPLLHHIFLDVFKPSGSREERKAVNILTADDLLPSNESEHTLGQIWDIRHRNPYPRLHFLIFYFDRDLYGLIDYTGLKFLDLNGFKTVFEHSQSLGYQWKMIRLTPLPPPEAIPPAYNLLNIISGLETVAMPALLLSGFAYILKKLLYSGFDTDDAPVIKKKKKKRDRPGSTNQANPPQKPEAKNRCDEVCKDRAPVCQTDHQKRKSRQERVEQQAVEQKQRREEANAREEENRRLWEQKRVQELEKEQEEKENREKERQKKLEEERQKEREEAQRQVQEREQRVSEEEARVLLSNIDEALSNETAQPDIERLLIERLRSGWQSADLIHVIINEDKKFRLRFKLHKLFKNGVLDNKLNPFHEGFEKALQSQSQK